MNTIPSQPVDTVLAAIENRLHEQTHYDAPFLSDVVRSLVFAGGKRMRPRLMATLGVALDVPHAVLTACGAAVELVHAGTLLQDDVIDRSELRRGQPTAWVRWGVGAGVLGGNLVYMRAFDDLLARGYAREARWLIEALHAVVVGEMYQQEQSWRPQPDEAALVHIARHKTGAFFGYICQVLTKYVGGDAERARQWGVTLGYGFQLADDLLDFGGPIDKPTAKDLREGFQTLPIFRAAKNNPALRAAIARAYERRAEADYDAAYALIRQSDARDATLAELAQVEAQLMGGLNGWTDGKGDRIEAAAREFIRASLYREI